MKLCDSAEHTLVAHLRMHCRGPSGAKRAAHLAEYLGIAERKLRETISHLREHHHIPIAGTPDTSYFWPLNRAQASHTIDSFGSRITSLSRVKNGIELGLDDLFGGPTLLDNQEIAA